MIHFIIHPVNPQRHYLEQTVSIMRGSDGVCVYPTDTVYGIGACVTNSRAIDRINKLLHKDKSRLFSFIFCGFSQISAYARLDNAHFKLMKRYLPGPFTFILPSTHYVLKKIGPRRKTVGVRIPDNIVCRRLVEILGVPLANASIKLPGHMRGDPDIVKPAVLSEVDIMLDCGVLDNPVGSTIVDLTDNHPVVVREGKGVFEG